jgi:hypothetical protein
LRVGHAVPDGLLVAQKIVEGIDIGLGFEEETVAHAEMVREGQAERKSKFASEQVS